jgi:hypothetical protein
MSVSITHAPSPGPIQEPIEESDRQEMDRVTSQDSGSNRPGLRTASRPLAVRAARATLVILASAAAGLLALLFITLETRLELFGFVVLLDDVETLVMLLLSALLVLQLTGPGRTLRVRQRLATASSRLREAPFRRQLGALLAVGFLLWQFEALLAMPIRGLRWKMKAAVTATPGITYRPSSAHVPHLVEQVVRQLDAGPTVVFIDDDDPRAHQASYYTYPRLLMMAPTQRTWSTRSRQLHYDIPDEAYPDPGSAPDIGASVRHAGERRAGLLVVDAEGLAVDAMRREGRSP